MVNFSKIKKTLLLVLALVSVFILGSGILSCGIIEYASKIELTDFNKKNVLTIKTDFRNVAILGDRCTFEVEGGLDAIKSTLSEDKAISHELINNVLLIKLVSDSVSFFAITELSDEAGRYILSNMTAYSSDFSILFPYHLCPIDKNDKIDAISETYYILNDNDIINSTGDYTDWKKFFTEAQCLNCRFDDTQKIIMTEHAKFSFAEKNIVQFNIV